MKIVGILRGGTGDYYESSLREGGDVIAFLSEHMSNQYKPVDILIDRDNIWHHSGIPTTPANLMHQVDMVWNTTHPSYEWMLKDLSVPVISQPAHFHTLRQSREMLREHMKKLGVHLPRRIVIHAYQPDLDGSIHKYAFRKAKETFEKFGAPWVVKSYPPNKDIGVRVVKTFEELVSAFEEKAREGVGADVEELISDDMAEVHTLAGFRGEDTYVFPATGSYFPNNKEKILALAKELHRHLGAGQYLHAKLSFHPKRGIFLHDARMLPDLHISSSLHKASELIGAKTHNIIESLLERASR